MPLVLILAALFNWSSFAETVNIARSCYEKGPVEVPFPMPRLNRDCNCTNSPTESLQAVVEAVNSGSEEENQVCNMSDPKIKANCIAFLNDPCVPQDSLKWALEVYKKNRGHLNMNKCLREPLMDELAGGKAHYSNAGEGGRAHMTNDRLEEKGIQNECQILINDTRVPYQGDFPAKRRTYFYLDLCSGAKRIGYFNLGTGSVNRGKGGNLDFTDRSGIKTTVLGAFLTSDKVFNLQNSEDGYPRIRRNLDGRLPAVQLFGLQESNNGSANDFKYLHVSPYKSSSGCPSVAGEDYVMIDQLSAQGPSLVVNYGPNMEDPNQCSE